MSKQYATIDNGNDVLVDVGIKDSDGTHNGQYINDGSGINMKEVIVGEKLTTIDISVGAMARDNTNPSEYFTSHEDLNSFVKCFFAELKEQVRTKD